MTVTICMAPADSPVPYSDPGEPGWEGVLKEWQIRTAVLPTDSTIANLLRELPREWRVAYEDKVAVVFERR